MDNREMTPVTVVDTVTVTLQQASVDATHKHFQAHVDLHVHPHARVVDGQPSVLHGHNLIRTLLGETRF